MYTHFLVRSSCRILVVSMVTACQEGNTHVGHEDAGYDTPMLLTAPWNCAASQAWVCWPPTRTPKEQKMDSAIIDRLRIFPERCPQTMR